MSTPKKFVIRFGEVQTSLVGLEFEVTEGFMDKLRSKPTTYEEDKNVAYVFGPEYYFKSYVYLGTHDNDVSSTSLIDVTDMTGKDEKRLGEALEDMEGSQSHEEIREVRKISNRILFIGDTPQGDVGADLFAHYDSDNNIDGLIINSYYFQRSHTAMCPKRSMHRELGIVMTRNRGDDEVHDALTISLHFVMTSDKRYLIVDRTKNLTLVIYPEIGFYDSTVIKNVDERIEWCELQYKDCLPATHTLQPFPASYQQRTVKVIGEDDKEIKEFEIYSVFKKDACWYRFTDESLLDFFSDANDIFPPSHKCTTFMGII